MLMNLRFLCVVWIVKLEGDRLVCHWNVAAIGGRELGLKLDRGVLLCLRLLVSLGMLRRRDWNAIRMWRKVRRTGMMDGHIVVKLRRSLMLLIGV